MFNRVAHFIQRTVLVKVFVNCKVVYLEGREGIFWHGAYFGFDVEPTFIFTLKCFMGKALA